MLSRITDKASPSTGISIRVFSFPCIMNDFEPALEEEIVFAICAISSKFNRQSSIINHLN
ncbi:hypothetical protein VCHA50P417_400004 [Vibrio chagasii]|nr:hypothetical protein VCHA35O142_10348 [Vibrio chagasii]CAH7221202.1 hypothetical protein VCHA54O485_390001 [Vibrio chagasii]CAH7267414.1 hypothetical protein VCHA55P509_400004 [Vibrio chagasii]CAH7273355.1 hypothetical protein VCHA50P417_400004 [Vibrio chagasii]CAH7374066.1 hypothetical protein VCHA49P381_60001 [Vibrio chagasii]